MKADKILLLISLAFIATFTAAQQGPFKHIIIIVQENRTPDNLFGSTPLAGCTGEHPFETGVDIVDGANGYYYDSNGNLQYGLICDISLVLNGYDANIKDKNGHMGTEVDPDHGYGPWTYVDGQ